MAQRITVGTYEFITSSYDYETLFSNGKYLNRGARVILDLQRPNTLTDSWQTILTDLVGTEQTITGLWLENPQVFITDETRVELDRLELVCHRLEYDGRGPI